MVSASGKHNCSKSSSESKMVYSEGEKSSFSGRGVVYSMLGIASKPEPHRRGCIASRRRPKKASYPGYISYFLSNTERDLIRPFLMRCKHTVLLLQQKKSYILRKRKKKIKLKSLFWLNECKLIAQLILSTFEKRV